MHLFVGEKSELDQRMLFKNIELTLLSVSSATVAKHLQGLGHKRAEPVENEPLKSRLITIQARVCRSELVVSQKNINFGRITVGESTNWIVSLTNISALPLMYSISKSGSINSSFLSFSFGRQGQIPPFSTHSIEINFKPTLAGPFEEELKIQNILNPQNLQSIIFKCKVFKAESFHIICHTNGDHSKDVTSLEKSAVNDAVGTEMEERFHLGEVIVGEYSAVLSFTIQNITSKRRQFIIDASHHDSLTMLPSRGASLDISAEEMISVCSLRCNFEEGYKKNRITEVEREHLEDKLEHFNQKLKIGKRKNREDKILKYQKKIDNVVAYMNGETESLEKERDSDDERDAGKEKSQASMGQMDLMETGSASLSVAISSDPSVGSTLANSVNAIASSVAYHTKIEGGSETAIRVKFTLVPSDSFFPWTGAMRFEGSLRVFEGKNEDIVKLIRFDAEVFSSRQSYALQRGEVLTTTTEGSSGFGSTDAEVPTIARSPRKLKVALDQQQPSLFIATIAQWCLYPTKQLYPRYRLLPQNVAGMGVKLIRLGQKSRNMLGSFSVASIFNGNGSLRVSCDTQFIIEGLPTGHVAFDASEHGQLDFALAPDYEHQKLSASDFYPELNSPLSPAGSKSFLIQWQPSLHLKPQLIVGSVCVEYRAQNMGSSSTQYIPFVGLLECKSIIQIDKYLNLGSLIISSTKSSSFVITNKSVSDHLHYVTMVVSVAQSRSAVGKIAIEASSTGVIPPLSSQTIGFSFHAISAGKFEQQLWVGNMNDRFDQKRMTIKANVVVAESELVLIPQLEFSEDGKLLPLNLGMIQVSTNTSVQSPDFVYKLQLVNISSRCFAVTALSNLKKQCYVFADEACCRPAFLQRLEPDSVMYLYIVIRPAINQQPAGVSKGSRELLGGIRLIFSLAESAFDSASTALVLSEEEVDAYNKANKLFERLVVFQAILGSSRLRVAVLTSSIHASEEKRLGDRYLYLKGHLRIRNSSSRFPLKYAYIKSPSTVLLGGVSITAGTDVSMWPQENLLIICDEAEGELLPGQSKDVVYWLLSTTHCGLLRTKLTILNLSTGAETAQELTAFFGDGSVLIHGRESDSVVALKTLTRMPGVVFLKESNHELYTAEKQPVVESFPLNQFKITLSNSTSTPRCLHPISNLPLEITVLDYQMNDDVELNTFNKECIDINHDGFVVCGSGFTIPAFSSIECLVSIRHNRKLSDALLGAASGSFASGVKGLVGGKIAFTSSSFVPFATTDWTLCPFIACADVAIECSLPIVKLRPSIIEFGRIKSNRIVDSAVTVENLSEVEIFFEIYTHHPMIKFPQLRRMSSEVRRSKEEELVLNEMAESPLYMVGLAPLETKDLQVCFVGTLYVPFGFYLQYIIFFFGIISACSRYSTVWTRI